MITNKPKDLEEQRDQWIKIFDDYIHMMEKLEGISVRIKIFPGNFDKMINVVAHYQNSALILDTSYSNFIDASNEITNLDVLYHREFKRLILENEALKSKFTSENRRKM